MPIIASDVMPGTRDGAFLYVAGAFVVCYGLVLSAMAVMLLGKCLLLLLVPFRLMFRNSAPSAPVPYRGELGAQCQLLRGGAVAQDVLDQRQEYRRRQGVEAH